jgi:hypothetical protein
MSIDAKKTCNTHTREKEKSGTCCQVGDVKENAEQLTYEHSPATMSIHALAKANPTKTYGEVEKMKEQYE